MILTATAFLALATACAPDIDPDLLRKQARKESVLDTRAVHHNTNGSVDYGLMQINDRNFSLLGLHSVEEALDPCRSLNAAANLYKILSRYNSGSPTKSLVYAASIMERVPADTGTAETVPPACDPDPDGWHVTATCQGTGETDSWHSTPVHEGH